MERKVNAISRVVMIVNDVDEATAFFEKFFGGGCKYEDVSVTHKEYEVRATICMEVGMEIIGPGKSGVAQRYYNVDGVDQLDPNASGGEVSRMLATILRHRGEGVMAIAYDVKSIDTFLSNASKNGINPAYYMMHDVRPRIIKDFYATKEMMIDQRHCYGLPVLLNEVSDTGSQFR